MGDEDGNPDVVAAARIIARKIRRTPCLVLALMSATAQAETNVDAAWRSCVNLATATFEQGDFEKPDWALRYAWDLRISDACQQVQEATKARALAKAERERQEAMDRFRDEQGKRITAEEPVIERGLQDPDGTVHQ